VLNLVQFGVKIDENWELKGFTVITPPRYNAPDMTPPTTRHKERGIFTTSLKNEAAYICDDHGFYSKSQNVLIISKYHRRYVL